MMRGVMNKEKISCTFLWFIENYSYCWHKKGESLNSPEFLLDSLEGTAWVLRLYPRGDINEEKRHISLYLRRSEQDEGPEEMFLNYELSVLSANESTLNLRECEAAFRMGEGFGRCQFVKIDEVLLSRKADYLPQDTLRVLCKMWRTEGNIQQVSQVIARTRIEIEQISFLHVTEKFSTLKPNEKKAINVRSSTRHGLTLSVSLYYSNHPLYCQNMIVEITPSDAKQTLISCKNFLVEKSGRLVECGGVDNRLDDARKAVKNLSLTLKRQVLLNKERIYLPDDKLSLQFECIFSTGVEYGRIEKSLHEIPTLTQNHNFDNGPSREPFEAVEISNVCSSVFDDLKSIYNSQILTDVELQTKTQSFPAHKIVLCARSSVFKAMLTNDMREKHTDVIQIDDLEDDTVQQFLLFLYSDQLEKLEWESAIKLYYAGHKYAIQKLKVMCSSFLMQNVSSCTASELLLLADTHNDPCLKKAVEDFIFKHDEEVFGSEEWRNLAETNPVLGSKTMCLKYMRK